MKRYVLTGAPGSGKTSIIRALEFAGHTVVEEAASDVIALRRAQGDEEHWKHASFIDDIVGLQKQRQLAATVGEVQFHDRCAVCTYALSVFLGFPISPALRAEVERLERDAVLARPVLFVENLGFVEPTAARRISFEDSLAFEAVHRETYAMLGYEMVSVPAAPFAERVASVLRLVGL